MHHTQIMTVSSFLENQKYIDYSCMESTILNANRLSFKAFFGVETR